MSDVYTGSAVDYWSVSDYFPGENDSTVCIKVVQFFSRVSQEFEPLGKHETPLILRPELNHSPLQPYQVSGRLRFFKKPQGLVPEDVPVTGATELCDFLLFFY